MIGLDTNVLVRYLVQDEAAQSRAATRLIEGSCTPEDPGFINQIVLCELCWVLERGYRYSREQVAGVVRGLLSATDLRVEDADAAWQALGQYESGKAGFTDSLIGLRNERQKATPTYTFDREAASQSAFALLEGFT